MNKSVVMIKNGVIYQKDQLVLNEIELCINQGEFAYLVGKTGSGKSSLLKVLYGDLPLAQGQGIVAGYNLNSLNRKNIPMLRRKLGIIFQDFNLLMDRNVQDNLLFVLNATGWTNSTQKKLKVDDVLNKVGLIGKNHKMPHEISGGEQQRVVIARALLNNPEIILADEPTGNLDPETSDEILLLIRQIAQEQGTAVLFATHDYKILENFPARIIRCQRGRVIDEENFVL